MALSAAATAAANRLSTSYNGGVYNATSNPYAMDGGGHQFNFIPALQDFVLYGSAMAVELGSIRDLASQQTTVLRDAATAARDAAIAASDNANTRAAQALTSAGSAQSSANSSAQSASQANVYAEQARAATPSGQQEQIDARLRVADKASLVEAVAGTDDAKYITALKAAAMITARGTQSGDLLRTYRAPPANENFLPADGSVYLKSAHPTLAAVLGQRFNRYATPVQRLSGSIYSNHGNVGWDGTRYFMLQPNTTASGAAMFIYTSLDGLSWTNTGVQPGAAVASATNWYAFGNGYYVIYAQSTTTGYPTIMYATSLSGPWTTTTMPSSTSVIKSLYYFGGKFWRLRYDTANSTAYVESVTSGAPTGWANNYTISPVNDAPGMGTDKAGTIIFVAYNGATNYLARSADNGVTWTLYSTSVPWPTFSGSAFPSQAIYGGGVWVAAGSYGTVYSTNGGINWSVGSSVGVGRVVYNSDAGMWWGSSGYYSADGISWVRVVPPFSLTAIDNFNVPASLLFLANAGVIWTSTLLANINTQFTLPIIASTDALLKNYVKGG